MKNNNFYELFFKEFKLVKQHFLKHINGIYNTHDKAKIVELLLTKIIFLWFLQEFGIFGDKLFLINLFKKCAKNNLNFYKILLKTLSSDYNSELSINIQYTQFQRILEHIQILNIRSLIVSNLENKYLDSIEIDNRLFYIDSDISKNLNEIHSIFNFLSKFNYELDEKEASTNVLTPRIFGVLFQKSKKQIGAFYTPKQVSYLICKKTIIHYLLNKINRSKNIKFSDINDLFKPNNKKFLNILYESILNIKILDPACGTGNFIIETILFLEEIYQKLIKFNFIENELQDIKKHIIINNIFGVDIDSKAIEMCKLRIYLNLLSTNQILSPNILYLINLNFQQGNSILSDTNLINNSTDIQMIYSKIKPILNQISKLKQILVNNNSNNSGNIYSQILNLINKAYNIMDNKFYQIINIKSICDSYINQKSRYSTDDEIIIRPFYWKINFHEILSSGGFDVILGNPPYIRQEKIKYKSILKNLYFSYTGTSDLYVYFIEKGIELLKNNGNLGYIISNKFTRTFYGKRIRNYILKNCKIIEYHDLINKKIFKNVSVDSCIIILAKSSKNKTNMIFINNEFYMPQMLLTGDSWNFIDSDNLKIKNCIEKNCISLEKYMGIPLSGIKTGLNDVFIVNEKKIHEIIGKNSHELNIFVRYIRGKDIKKWKYEFQGDYLIFTENINLDDYPNVKKYLLKFKERLSKRTDIIGTYKKWYELRPCKYYDKLKLPKIIFPDISKTCKFAYDDSGILINNTAYALPTNDLSLLAILNSRLIEYYYQFISVQLGTGFRFIQMFVKKIPIKVPDLKQKYILTKLSNYLLYLYRLKTNSKIEEIKYYFDNIILNCVVYELYLIDELKRTLPHLNLNDKLYQILKEISETNKEKNLIDSIISFYNTIKKDTELQKMITDLKKHDWIKIIEKRNK
ncbi:MAG: Eco57I restriction-modification methylase domain-containing protein [Candidatus Helarchaeota archaeon]